MTIMAINHVDFNTNSQYNIINACLNFYLHMYGEDAVRARGTVVEGVL